MKTNAAFSLILVSCWLAVAGVARAAEARPLSLADADIAQRFVTRRELVLKETAAGIDPADPSKGGFLNVAACLQRGENRAAALARFAKLNEPMPVDNMFWVYPMVTVMLTGHDNLDAASWARIRELWKIYWPSRGDTENHWVISYAGLYLAAQTLPPAGGDQWFNGQSSAENMKEARDYLLHWIDVTTAYGQGEYDSPNYIEEYAMPLSLLAGWSKDPVLREKARMLLDYIFYDFVVEQVDGYYGGAHSRVYPKQAVAPGRTPSSALAWLLFGLGDRQAGAGATVVALSGYTPPPILERIARDMTVRPYVERELKRTRWRLRHAGPDSFVIGDKRTVPVYKYSYVDRDFVLGSSQGGLLQPIQQQTWSLVWRTDKSTADAANTFFGVQPSSSALEGAMYFGGDADTLANLIARSKADYDSPDKLTGGSPYEQVFQDGTALIALYDIAPGARFPHITTFFSRDLTGVDEDKSGWIFAQGGPVYIAYRPLAPGEWKPYDWTGLLRHGGGGWISAGFADWGTGHRCYVSSQLRNGYVVQVAPTRDYASFNAFKSAVRALPLTYSTKDKPQVTFTALGGQRLQARYGEPPTVDGKSPDYAHWPLFDGPFAHEARGSGKLDLRHGGERLLLDFNHTRTEESATAVQP
ncbi:hypothetical protein K0B96_01160 [Horticoccus luteus]|uniref:Heparinase II/III-like protein n=1 Tax=Horticoccus luteus TaxID=2862869 RepID=A0A8F9XLI3_9BACT|nr:hypothetical protein [Horticoccus luteus]QYM79256.1 hypothetical protein K0B96_01160 [Horticoccus luteus]